MGVTRYHDVTQMPPLEKVTGSDLVRRIREVWTRAQRFSGLRCTPGVQKFTDIQAAQEAREKETRARVQRLRAQRRENEHVD